MPDDPWFENIDSLTWHWMFMNWIRDTEEKHEFATDYSIFNGSFANPDMAKKMMDQRNPTYELSDEEFEESTRKMLEQSNKIQLDNVNKSLHRRKRRIISE